MLLAIRSWSWYQSEMRFGNEVCENKHRTAVIREVFESSKECPTSKLLDEAQFRAGLLSKL